MPVSRSVWARRCSCASRSRSWVTSTATVPIANGCPSSSRSTVLRMETRRRSPSRVSQSPSCGCATPEAIARATASWASSDVLGCDVDVPEVPALELVGSSQPVNRCSAGLVSRIRPSPSTMHSRASLACMKARSRSSERRAAAGPRRCRPHPCAVTLGHSPCPVDAPQRAPCGDDTTDPGPIGGSGRRKLGPSLHRPQPFRPSRSECPLERGGRRAQAASSTSRSAIPTSRA